MKKFRQERGLFLVEGIKLVAELIASDLEIDQIYTTESFEALENVESDRITPISHKELDRLSSLRSPNSVLAIAKTPMTRPMNDREPLVLVLDGIRDPGNLGTIIRSARWFGVSTIVCSEDCAEAYNPKVVQSTMGALFHVNIHYMNLESYLERAIESGYRIVGATMEGESLNELKPDKKTILMIGSESHGIRPGIIDKCTLRATIPNMEMDRKVESLNASVACALMLSALSKPTGP